MCAVLGAHLLAAALWGAALAESAAIVVQAPDTPVRLDRATVVAIADAPPIVVYTATNTTGDTLDQFTVMAYVFDAQGTLKARQGAPARRTLDARGTKVSTLVLDGTPIESTDRIVIGVNQAQKVGSETWWRAELQDAAVAAVRPPKR
jgi:hypothetical protein